MTRHAGQRLGRREFRGLGLGRAAVAWAALAGAPALAGVSALAGAGPRQGDGAFDFEATARQYLEHLGYAGETHESLPWPAFLETDVFTRLRLGVFELLLPPHALGERALEDPRDDAHAERLQTAAGQMVALSEAWGKWTLRSEEEREAMAEDAEHLAKWIGRWRPRKLRDTLDEDGDGDLLEGLKADERTRAALARFAELLTPAPAPTNGGEAAEPSPVRVVVVPSRRTYVELLSVAGWLDPSQRAHLYQEANLFTPNVWTREAQIVPLLHPAWPNSNRTVFEGWEVERYLTSTFEQHVAERLAASLLHEHYSVVTDPLLETALATNLTLAVLGEIRVVNDFSSFSWNRSGGQTQGYSRFVPGGASGGGILPPRKASQGPIRGARAGTRHVLEKGHGYFTADLRERQETGYDLARRDRSLPAELRRDERPHFALEAEGDEHVVRAPFLGDVAAEKEFPPLTYLDDYERFFSVYRASFLHWLAGEEGPDPELFADFLQRTAHMGTDETVASIVADVYGAPMGWQAEGSSLEADFLTWLSEQSARKPRR